VFVDQFIIYHTGTYVNCILCSAEAEKKFGESSLKIYTSTFVPLYHAVTQRKIKTHMKMICVLPTEKVQFLLFFFTLDVHFVQLGRIVLLTTIFRISSF